MNPKTVAEWLTIAIVAYGASVWIYLQSQTRSDVLEIKNNHLKHIYHLLGLICKKLDIPITEPEGSDGRDKASNG